MSQEAELWGVILVLYPNDFGMSCEVQRAPDDGAGGPDTGETVLADTLAPSQQFFVDHPPTSNETYHYRARAVGEGYTASEWTAWYPVRPMLLPEKMPIAPSEPLCDLDMFVDPVSGEVALYCSANPTITAVVWWVEANEATWPDWPASRMWTSWCHWSP